MVETPSRISTGKSTLWTTLAQICLWARILSDPRSASDFHTLVMDEAHQIRNLNTLQATAVRWVKGDFNVLFTATPASNAIEDVKGIVPFILNPANEKLWQKNAP